MNMDSDREWLTETVRRADQGDKDAMEELDELTGRRIDEIGASTLDGLIAEGSSWAIYLLGRLLEQRGQTEDDFCTALRLYMDSAGKMNPYAMVAVGRIFENGNGVVKSFHNAYIQYKHAASLGCPPAERWMDENGDKGRC